MDAWFAVMAVVLKSQRKIGFTGWQKEGLSLVWELTDKDKNR
jgi:hypothetical protein